MSMRDAKSFPPFRTPARRRAKEPNERIASALERFADALERQAVAAEAAVEMQRLTLEIMASPQQVVVGDPK